jgi:hypothetical protein
MTPVLRWLGARELGDEASSAAAAPTLADPRGSRPTRPARPSPERPGTAYGVDEHPRFAPDDGEPHETDLERLYPDGMWPGRPPRDGRSAPGPRPAPGEDPAAPRTNARPGRARTSVVVRETGEITGRVKGRVQPGERVMVVAEHAGWVLIIHEGEGAVTMGWTEASGIALL